MRDVDVVGVATTRFGVQLDRSVKDLTADAVHHALDDAQAGIEDIQAIFFGNTLSGLITGQESLRGEVACLPLGFGTIPIHNIENACATGASALHSAWLSVAAGLHDTVLVIGAEKANHIDRQRTFAAYGGGFDLDETFEMGEGAGQDRTIAVDRQAILARRLNEELGVTREHMARFAAVFHHNGSLNPVAHRQGGATYEEILASRVVADPITKLMMSPITDGGAAVVLSARESGNFARRTRIAGSTIATCPPIDDPTGPSAVASATRRVFEMSGFGPADIDLAEVHDASIAYAIMSIRDTGLCPPGDEIKWIESDHMALTGGMPINTSGGLLARGHPIGATGVAQVAEIVQQLRGDAGARQVPSARIGLASIGGGVIGFQTAVAAAHVLVQD